MSSDRLLETQLIVMIERACRFVEEPDGSRSNKQPRKRQPLALTGGQPATRPVRNPFEREGHQRRFDMCGRPARAETVKGGPESQDFARCQIRFDAILMADVVQLLAIGGDIGLDRRRPPEESPARGGDERGEQPQKAGFPAAVRSGQYERLTRCQAKRDSREYETLAAPTSEFLGDQMGLGQFNRRQATIDGRPPRAKKRLRWGKTGAARPRSMVSTAYEVWGTNL
jgi:hypothetical protein